VHIRRKIQVSGLVQGVGFRPFVFRLAQEGNLAGSVMNNASGVTIEVQGRQEAIEEFITRLRAEAPPLSRIGDVSINEIPCISDHEFSIIESRKGEAVHTLISPDVATCDDCLREMLDPADRRFHYPFINCTNCGPRYTIVRNIPYDRASTSMAQFQMCATCQAEYDDPRSRRFHAQPNACWECGPRLEFWSSADRMLAVCDPIAETIAALRAGQIVAIKGLGGFHLAADALNTTAVDLLRRRKHRADKPFAVMVPNLEAVEEFCEIGSAERAILSSLQRPIVLLRRRESCLIPAQVAPGVRELGVFLPYTPLHHLLFTKGGFKALIMTSGNMSEEPIAIDNDEARGRLRELADCFLMHNREILLRCDDSVVRASGSQVHQLRRSRGFVPVPVFLHKKIPAVLAVGGELKNTICLSSGSQAFLSQHLGDLENLAGYGFFAEVIEHLEKILEIQPSAIAHDLHPDYFSTKWALEQGLPLIGVQHHHAHIASCMAENHLDGRVVGFSLDGTGYGTDGAIWGGEVLVAGYEDFQRAAHLEYVPLPGGAAAIREPWRMALSYLAHSFGHDYRAEELPFLKDIDAKNRNLIFQIIERSINSPLTSSCGRLFDAVAAIIGIRQKVNYEGQAAIELEVAIDNSSPQSGYPFELTQDGDGWIIGVDAMFHALIDDVRCSVEPGIVSARFHNGLVDVLANTADRVREQTGLDRVCFSGGTFNNLYLSQRLQKQLEQNGFTVWTQREVPCGDGGLSLGQAMIAAHRLRK